MILSYLALAVKGLKIAIEMSSAIDWVIIVLFCVLGRREGEYIRDIVIYGTKNGYCLYIAVT